MTSIKYNVILYGMKKINELLAEINVKQKKLRRLPVGAQKNLDEWYRVELTYTSNAIEGNTLSRAETALVVEKGITVAGKSIREHLEAVNHANAWEWVIKQAKKSQELPSERQFLDLHQMILQKIDDVEAGRYRRSSVRIAGSRVVLPNYLKVPDLIANFFEWLKNTENEPVQRAIETHYQLVSIHPFADGNGRTARLFMNWLLMLDGYPPIVVRKEDRREYLVGLETAQLGGSKEKYHKLMFESLSRSLDIYLEAMGKEVKSDENQKLLKVGQVARLAGESVPTIRHWTKMGLLTVSGHTKGGYQLYKIGIVEVTKRVRELQKNRRLSLEEIREELD